MVQFEVKICGEWVPVVKGIILGDGKRLAYWRDASTGVAHLGNWQLSPSTLNNPKFKTALWDGLSIDEKVQALARRVLAG